MFIELESCGIVPKNYSLTISVRGNGKTIECVVIDSDNKFVSRAGDVRRDSYGWQSLFETLQNNIESVFMRERELKFDD